MHVKTGRLEKPDEQKDADYGAPSDGTPAEVATPLKKEDENESV